MEEVTAERTPRRRTVCIAEDRPALEPAIRLLLASLAREWPGQHIDLFFTPETSDFDAWVGKFPDVAFHRSRIAGEYSKYDVKPHAFLALFDMGAEDVVWIDSDIIIAGKIAPLFDGLDDLTVVITEEALGDFHSDDNGLRARLWGFPVGREFPFCLNTGVLRMTSLHRPLIERWRDLLQSETYKATQSVSWRERPVHCLGDQDVLTALLASTEFAATPCKLLKRGADVLQYFGAYGYTLRERCLHLFTGPPPIIHSMGHKPWWEHEGKSENGYERFVRLYREMSPYTFCARDYRDELVSADWLSPRSGTARWLDKGSFGSMALNGAPLAIVADLKRLFMRWRGRKH